MMSTSLPSCPTTAANIERPAAKTPISTWIGTPLDGPCDAAVPVARKEEQPVNRKRPKRGRARAALLASASLLLLCLSVLLDARGFAAGIEDGMLRPGTVTVVTLSRLRSFRADLDPARLVDLDVEGDAFAVYRGDHAPRTYRAQWEGWTTGGWREYAAEFEVNGPTIILPIWRRDGGARIVYLGDHMSERRYWDGATRPSRKAGEP